jgi:hypothetical protein
MSRLTLLLTTFCAAVFLARSAAADSDELRKIGKEIYRNDCQNCHGKNGEGVPKFYPDRLTGDATIGELTDLISDTMPEEDPDLCTGKNARAVSAYIHHAFYSEAAQVRNRPPRIRLARLTGEQLRQSISGLYGSFTEMAWQEEPRGVLANYFQGDQWKKEKLKIERTDPVLDFNFGHDGPDKGKGIDPKEFYINWSGSLRIDETGRYEIIVRSSCSFVLEFGRHGRELINNHVKSAGKTEFRRTLQLTGGRAYPFKIDFTQRKRKTEQPPATFTLAWVPPGGVEEVIPMRHLIKSTMPASFALQTKLPADDRSYGYERGTSVNRQWDESTTKAAIEFSQAAITELWPEYERKHRKKTDKNRSRLRGFAKHIVSTAFRGELSEAQQKTFIDAPIDTTPDDAEAIKKICLMALKSPRFLYPTLDFDQSDSQRAANRLALVMFDSLPVDEWLRKKVSKNQLKTDDQINDVVWRMVNDFRTQAKTRAFLYEWLELTHSEEISKDKERFPGFDDQLIADLRASLDTLLHQVVWSDQSDFRQLIQADWSPTNERLAAFYGKAWKPTKQTTKDSTGELAPSIADANAHVGVLTHPLLMADLSYHRTTSPIHRGVFLYRKILGRTLRPPNAAFSPLNPDLHPKLTTRQRVSLQTDEVSCQVCHSKINTLGFSLEKFDPVGRFRAKEKGQTVDATGSYLDRTGQVAQFDGARELADFLVSNSDSHRAFVDSCFEHFVKQPAAAYGADTLDRLTREFQENNFSIRDLIVSIAWTVVREVQQDS